MISISNHSLRTTILHILGIALLMLTGLMPASAQSTLDVERIQRATVLIMQARNVGNTLAITCVGSGTLVSRDGLILTNAHHTLTDANCNGDTLIVAMNVRPGEPPVARYQADIVQADAGLDIALLRIARQTDGRLVERSSLALPFVELGDSEAVQLDQTITVVGFPGIGDDPVAFERGTISGFAAEPSGGDKSWIKTSATIPAVMSGGGAYNQDGELIGIPTTAPLRADAASGNCISVQDTNADGLINNSDICIAVAGFINLLRPSSFARPLLRAASLGLTVQLPFQQAVSAPVIASASDRPRFRYLGFAPSVNEAGMPSTIIRALPTGSDRLYLFFDYENMTPETVYELRVNTNGVPNPVFSISPVRWSGGRRGLWYVGSSGQTFPNGTYDFTLFINGIAEGNARLVVGGAAEESSEFSGVVFGLLDLQGNVTGTGFVLPTATTASARFLFRNMQVGTPWAAIWYYEGTEVQRTPDDTVWSEADGTSGTKTISIQDPNGLLPGSYRLELYIAGRLATVSDFTLAGAQDGAFARIFSNTRFTTASTVAEAQAGAAVSNFSSGTTDIFGLFDWDRISFGTLWRLDWSVDGEIFFSQTLPWAIDATGQNYVSRIQNPSGLPDGTYRLDLYIGRIQFDSATARVGIGQLPIDQFADASGVTMRGRVIDSISGVGLSGVSVVLISDLFSVADFTRDWLQTQVYAESITDRNGRFEITRPLQRDAPYSIIFLAEGYLPVTADGVELNEETYPGNDPIDIIVQMTHE